MSSVAAVKIWIGLSVFASVAGWLLSLVDGLGRTGYLVLGGITLFATGVWWSRNRTGREAFQLRWDSRKLRRRFRRPSPLLFLLLMLLVLLGGLLYPPSNHTGLSYRTPRVLHWLAEGHWHWIDAPNYRMNNRTCGFEWLSALMFAGFKTDRLLFLLNFIPTLLVPGLLFSLLTRLGVAARVAWQWMWVFPTGYVFLLQAGSIGNDAFPVVYALAAIDFGCRAWQSRRVSDLWYSGLAIALLTGAKASNLPLCLMWLVLIAPLARVLLARPIGTGVIGVLMVLVSAVPTMMLNTHYCGDWSGLNLEKSGMNMAQPLVGLWGNQILLALNNLCPPVFPMAGWWNRHALDCFPGFILEPILKNFEQPFYLLWEIPTEDWAGLGLGVTVLMFLAGAWSLGGICRRSRAQTFLLPMPRWVWKATLLSGWIGFAAFCAKSGMVTPGRLIAPYYPLLLPVFLLGANQLRLIRAWWWRGLMWLTFLTAFFVVIVTPPRPLWPAHTILTKLQARHPDSRLIQRALTTYTVYGTRSDPWPEGRAALPADVKIVGMVAGPDELDISLWRPFGARRVKFITDLRAADPLTDLRARNIQYAVLSEMEFVQQKVSLADWLARTRATVLTEFTATITVTLGPQKFYVVRFPSDEPAPPAR